MNLYKKNLWCEKYSLWISNQLIGTDVYWHVKDICIGVFAENLTKEAVATCTFMTSQRDPLWNGDTLTCNSQMA